MSRTIEILKGELERVKDTLEHAQNSIGGALYDQTLQAFQECADKLKKTHEESWWEYWVITTNFQDDCAKGITLSQIIESLEFRQGLLQVQLENTPQTDQETRNKLKEKQTEVNEAISKAKELAEVLKALCDLAKAHKSVCDIIDSLGGS